MGCGDGRRVERREEQERAQRASDFKSTCSERSEELLYFERAIALEVERLRIGAWLVNPLAPTRNPLPATRNSHMAGLRLDGAGQAKMKTLEDAMNVLLRLNGLVEQYALQIKRNQSGGTFMTNIKRQLPGLSEMLKAQFGMIADQVMQTSLGASRGASEQVRVRTLREGVAQIKVALEIAIAHVKEKHDLDAASDDDKAQRA